MNNRDVHSYEMILRVDDFGDLQAVSFPPTSRGGKLFARVKVAATKLRNHIAQHSSGRAFEREGTVSKAVARAALREALERIRRTARAMAEEMPELAARFRLPRSVPDQELVGLAQAIATDALPLKDLFISFAMPDDFLEELTELIADFDEAFTGQQTGRGKRLAATAVIDDTLDDALSAVRQLNAIVRNTFADDPEPLSRWATARHVQREPRRNAIPQAPTASRPSSPPLAS